MIRRASERKRRQVYRGEVHGQLPFDTRGMDDLVPAIDFSPTGGLDSVYSFERSDVESEYRSDAVYYHGYASFQCPHPTQIASTLFLVSYATFVLGFTGHIC